MNSGQSTKKAFVYNGFLLYTIVLGGILLIISSYRALNSNITYDEAYTYDFYVHYNPFDCFKDLITDKEILANNHLLNSFFISIVDRVANEPYNEFLIRLPNLIFYLLYIIFSYKICKDYKHKYLYFSLLSFNYGVHEYFGLARGYGIACSLTLTALYFMKLWLKEEKYKYLNICYYVLLLACYANSVSLLGFASIILFSQLYILKEHSIFENINYLKTQALKLLPLLPMLVLIINYHFKVSSDELIVYGGKDNFFNIVFVSFTSLYGFKTFPATITAVFIVLLVLVLLIIKCKSLSHFGPQYLFIIYLVLLIALTKIFDKMWPTGRELIPMFPIFLFSLFYVLEKYNIKHVSIEFLISSIFLISFFNSLDLTKMREWTNDDNIKAIVYDAMDSNMNIDLSDSEYTYSVEFYRNKYRYIHEPNFIKLHK